MRTFKKMLTVLMVLTVWGSLVLNACPVCERQQPKILKGVVHGPPPQDEWDYTIAALATIIVLATLFYSIKYLVSPKENDSLHIKLTFIND